MALLPNAELVAKGWLLGALSDDADADVAAEQIATRLPDTPWRNDLFIQIMQVGGDADGDNPLEMPVVSYNVYAETPGSTKPPYGRANEMAMRIWRATFKTRYNPHPAVLVALPTGYDEALVQVARALNPPKRIPSDPSQYAVYNVDVALSWTIRDLVIDRV